MAATKLAPIVPLGNGGISPGTGRRRLAGCAVAVRDLCRLKELRKSPSHYPIRAVSRLTGIGIDTLRAWERRYGAVTPVRDERGRMYTEADVVRLRLLRRAVEQGHSIGRLAALTDTDLHRLAIPAGTITAHATDPVRPTSLDTAALSAALLKDHAAGIDQEIARLAAVLRPLDLLRAVLNAGACAGWQRLASSASPALRRSIEPRTLRHILGSFLRLYA